MLSLVKYIHLVTMIKSVQDQMGKCLCVTEKADTVMQNRMKSHSSSVWTERIKLTKWWKRYLWIVIYCNLMVFVVHSQKVNFDDPDYVQWQNFYSCCCNLLCWIIVLNFEKHSLLIWSSVCCKKCAGSGEGKWHNWVNWNLKPKLPVPTVIVGVCN